MTSEASVAPPPTYCILRDFLPAAEHAAVLAWSLAHENEFRPSTLVGNVIDEDRRRSQSIRGKEFSLWKQILSSQVEACRSELYATLGVEPVNDERKELELVAYNDGAHFGAHIDTITGARRDAGGDRILSLVYWFFREPKGFSGGELRFHRLGNSKGECVDIAPEQNCLVAFPSWSPHEVQRVDCPSREFADSRFAINCWLYRAARDE